MSTLKDKEVRERFIKEFGPDTDQMVSAHQSFMPGLVADWWLTEITKARESSEAQGARNMLELFDEYQDRYSVKEIIKLGKSIFALSSINEKEG